MTAISKIQMWVLCFNFDVSAIRVSYHLRRNQAFAQHFDMTMDGIMRGSISGIRFDSTSRRTI